MRLIICVLVALISTATVNAQSTSANSDSQGLEGIRAEIHQLRQDLRTLVGMAQRAQILVARVQVQDAAVKRAQERIDETKSKLTAMQDEERHLNFELKRNEQSLEQSGDASAANAAQRKDLEDSITQLKAVLEQRANSEQETQARLTEAEEQLRVEQAKLGRLQDELDRLDKTLEDPTHH